MISPASVALWIAFVSLLVAAAFTHNFPVFGTGILIGILIGCISMMLAVLERGGEE